MRYVVAGYVLVLSLLFLYGLQLLWRHRRLGRAVARVMAADAAGPLAVDPHAADTVDPHATDTAAVAPRGPSRTGTRTEHR